MAVLRRLGCLAALLTLAVWLAVLGGLAWFGSQAYQHVTDAQALTDRLAVVGAAWASDPTALAKAASGVGGVRPKGLSPQPFQQVGARPTVAYHGTTATIRLTTTRLACETDPLTVDVVETPAAVVVLVHVRRPWLPDVRGWWDQVRAGSSCVNQARPATLTVTLGSGLGRRAVVDAVSGLSVTRV